MRVDGIHAVRDRYTLQIGTAIEMVDSERHYLVYEAFLQGMKLSGSRMISLDKETCMAYFAAMCELAKRYFPSHIPIPTDKTHKALAAIDEAVRNKDFTKYILACNLL